MHFKFCYMAPNLPSQRLFSCLHSFLWCMTVLSLYPPTWHIMSFFFFFSCCQSDWLKISYNLYYEWCRISFNMLKSHLYFPELSPLTPFSNEICFLFWLKRAWFWCSSWLTSPIFLTDLTQRKTRALKNNILCLWIRSLYWVTEDVARRFTFVNNLCVTL